MNSLDVGSPPINLSSEILCLFDKAPLFPPLNVLFDKAPLFPPLNVLFHKTWCSLYNRKLGIYKRENIS